MAKKPKWMTWDEFCENYNDSYAMVLIDITGWAYREGSWPKNIQLVEDSKRCLDLIVEYDWIEDEKGRSLLSWAEKRRAKRDEESWLAWKEKSRPNRDLAFAVQLPLFQ